MKNSKRFGQAGKWLGMGWMLAVWGLGFAPAAQGAERSEMRVILGGLHSQQTSGLDEKYKVTSAGMFKVNWIFDSHLLLGVSASNISLDFPSQLL